MPTNITKTQLRLASQISRKIPKAHRARARDISLIVDITQAIEMMDPCTVSKYQEEFCSTASHKDGDKLVRDINRVVDIR